MSCRDRVLDVFVTNGDSDYGKGYDDTFVGPMWSVKYLGMHEAVVVDASSDWVTFCQVDANGDDVDVGDLVRFGHASSDGHTDYVTVLARKKITTLYNGVWKSGFASVGNQAIKMYKGSDGTFESIVALGADHDPNWDTDPSAGWSAADGVLIGELGAGKAIDLWAYRLNVSINLTDVDVQWYASELTSAQQDAHVVKYRHLTMHSPDLAPTAQRLYYPMYKVNKWLTNNGDISVSRDHGVKSLHWIKLVGYSVFNKRQVGFQAAHEMEQDDWVAMRVNEVDGGVVSNNPAANGAFCVLHVGGSKDNETGAIEYHAHDPQGLYTHYFDNHNSTIRNLNLRFLDRKGNAAHFGRIHLWFKLCVHHG